MKKVLVLFSCIVFMSSCVTYKVERIPYGSDQTFREIIDSKSVILISDLVICDSKDSVIVSEGQPKIIKDFKIVDGVISGVIVEIPEYDSSEYLISTSYNTIGDNEFKKVVYTTKNLYYDIKYFRKDENIKNNFAKRKFRKAKEVVYLTTNRKLEYGPFSMPLSDLENGTEKTAAIFKVNSSITILKNLGVLPPLVVFISYQYGRAFYGLIF
tara:strand:+ start:211 stop:846 length:636 start_codon:yes stop_codon:yes gene_type:complete